MLEMLWSYQVMHVGLYVWAGSDHRTRWMLQRESVGLKLRPCSDCQLKSGSKTFFCFLADQDWSYKVWTNHIQTTFGVVLKCDLYWISTDASQSGCSVRSNQISTVASQCERSGQLNWIPKWHTMTTSNPERQKCWAESMLLHEEHYGGQHKEHQSVWTEIVRRVIDLHFSCFCIGKLQPMPIDLWCQNTHIWSDHQK